jgi:hypothetical protein
MECLCCCKSIATDPNEVNMDKMYDKDFLKRIFKKLSGIQVKITS